MMMILSLCALLSNVPDECVCSFSAFAKCQFKSAALKSYQQPGLWAKENTPEKLCLFEVVQNGQIWWVFSIIWASIQLYSLCFRIFFCGGINVSQKLNITICSVQSWKVPMLKIPQLCARGTAHPFLVIQATLKSLNWSLLDKRSFLPALLVPNIVSCSGSSFHVRTCEHLCKTLAQKCVDKCTYALNTMIPVSEGNVHSSQ